MKLNLFSRGIFSAFFYTYFIQHCFICRPSDSTVSEDAVIEPCRTVATLAMANSQSDAVTIRLDLIHTRLDLVLIGYRSHLQSATDLIHTWLISSTIGQISSTLGYISSSLGLISSTLGQISYTSNVDLIHNRLDLIHIRLDLIHTYKASPVLQYEVSKTEGLNWKVLRTGPPFFNHFNIGHIFRYKIKFLKSYFASKGRERVKRLKLHTQILNQTWSIYIFRG